MPRQAPGIGEEEVADIVDDAHTLRLAGLPRGDNVGYLVLDADVVVAEAIEEAPLAPVASLLGGKEVEHHPAERHQAGVGPVAPIRNLHVELEAETVAKVRDGVGVAISDGIDVAHPDELEVFSHPHRFELAPSLPGEHQVLHVSRPQLKTSGTRA